MTFTELQAEKQMSIGKALEWLEHEFLLAIHRDPECHVSTPGFPDPTQPVYEVIRDYIGSRDPEPVLTLMRMVARFAQAGDVEAAAWIARQARAHAEYHADEFVAECVDD